MYIDVASRYVRNMISAIHAMSYSIRDPNSAVCKKAYSGIICQLANAIFSKWAIVTGLSALSLFCADKSRRNYLTYKRLSALTPQSAEGSSTEEDVAQRKAVINDARESAKNYLLLQTVASVTSAAAAIIVTVAV